MTFEHVSENFFPLIKEWFVNDSEGIKYLSSYSEPANWLKLIDNKYRFGWILIVDSSEIGLLDLEISSNKIGYFSILISRDYRNKGYAQKALEKLFMESKRLGVITLEAGCEQDNIAIQNTLTSKGFKIIGHDKDDFIRFSKEL